MPQQWTTRDKAGWGEGPWQHEPDKVQWVDAQTGLDCLIVRGPHGALCGYVGLPPGHPLHGADYETVNEAHDPDVHGWLTFAARCDETAAPGEGICHVPAPGRPGDVWWLGFDCAHAGDACPAHRRLFPGLPAREHLSELRDLGDLERHEAYRDLGYVTREVEKLAAQLLAVLDDVPQRVVLGMTPQEATP